MYTREVHLSIAHCDFSIGSVSPRERHIVYPFGLALYFLLLCFFIIIIIIIVICQTTGI